MRVVHVLTASSLSTPRTECDSEEDNYVCEIVSPPASKKAKLDARTKGKNNNSHTQFLEAFAAIRVIPYQKVMKKISNEIKRM